MFFLEVENLKVCFRIDGSRTAIAVLGEEFTEQNHFLNSTLKMVRGKIIEFYRNRIDFAYTPAGKSIYNHQNLIIISRLGTKVNTLKYFHYRIIETEFENIWRINFF